LITEIRKIATIQTGIYVKPGVSGDIIYLQARHFNNLGEFVFAAPDLTYDNKIEKHILKPGDILVASKGYVNFAALYTESFGLAVPSSVFLILKNIQTNYILPEFFVWYLNHPQSKQYFQNCAKGTGLPSINKTDLENLPMTIPTIEKQKLILHIESLQKKEKGIRAKINELNEKITNYILIKALK
jgi:restriction endonuclease S subunit